MKQYGLDMILSDGSRNGHSPEVKEICIENNITLYPLSSKSESGYSPFSPDLMPLETIFSKWQHSVSIHFNELYTKNPAHCTPHLLTPAISMGGGGIPKSKNAQFLV